MPPAIVFKGATTVQPRWVSEKAYPGTHYAVSNSGWMEGPIFFNWFNNAFLPYIAKVREERQLPDQEVVLIFDGHASHITLQLCKLAMVNKVTLVRLPSHLTDKLQPLDKCVFGPVKTSWEKQLVEYGKSQMGQSHQRLAKKQFSELLGEVWRVSMTSANIIAGFRSTGIFPLNSNLFPENEFDPIDLRNYKIKKNEEKKKKEEEESKSQGSNQLSISSTPLNSPETHPSTSQAATPTQNIHSTTTNSDLELNLQEQTIPQAGLVSPAAVTPRNKSVVEIFAETLKSSKKKLQTKYA